MKTIRVMALVIAWRWWSQHVRPNPRPPRRLVGPTPPPLVGPTQRLPPPTPPPPVGPTTAAGGTETTAGAAGETPYEHLNQAYAGEIEGTEVVISAQWIEAEEDSFNAALQPFRDATGIDVVYEPLTDYETALQALVDGGDAPDLAQIAQPGKMQQYAERARWSI